MGSADWPTIYLLTKEISTVVKKLDESLIDEDFKAAALKPLEGQCKRLYKMLDDVFDSDDESGAILTAGDNARDTVLDLVSLITLVIKTSNRLHRGSDDRADLEEEWMERRKKLLKIRRPTCQILDAFVKAIETSALVPPQVQEGEPRAG